MSGDSSDSDPPIEVFTEGLGSLVEGSTTSVVLAVSISPSTAPLSAATLLRVLVLFPPLCFPLQPLVSPPSPTAATLEVDSTSTVVAIAFRFISFPLLPFPLCSSTFASVLLALAPLPRPPLPRPLLPLPLCLANSVFCLLASKRVGIVASRSEPIESPSSFSPSSSSFFSCSSRK